jgi:predicted enzyme related to lactoylglutathione lyase
MNRVIHFELAADDPQRAIAFYEKVFGWKIERWGGPADYWLVTTGPEGEPGINGGLQRRGSPTQSVINTIGVDDLDAAVARVIAAGGAVMEGKMAVPGVGYLAYCLDTEGNPFGLMQADTSAAQ